MTVSVTGWPEPVLVETDGLRVVCQSRPGPVLAVRLACRVGARDDTVFGATHMLEHLLFRSPAGAEARRRVERLGGEVGAVTTREQLAVDIVVLPEDATAAASALRMIVGVAPRLSELEQERPVVLRELGHEQEERRRIWQLLNEALYGEHHPLAAPILGTEASLTRLAIGDVQRSAMQLVRDRCALALVGAVEPSEVAPLFADVVATGGGGGASSLPADLGAPRRRHEERRSQLLHVAVGWRFGGIADPALAALRLAEIILAHGSGSRLYERLRTRQRLAYGVSTVLVPYQDAGHLSALASVHPSHGAHAEMALIAELERLAARGPTWSELDASRRQHAGRRARTFESSRRLAAYVSTQVLWDRLRPLDAEQAVLEQLTPRDVRNACAALLGGDGHAVVSVGRSAALSTARVERR